MTKNAKRYLAVIGVALAVGLGLSLWRSSSYGGAAAGITKSTATTGSSSSVVATISTKVEPQEPHHSDAAAVNQMVDANAKRMPPTVGPAPSEVPMQLAAEAGIVIDDGSDFKGIRDVGSDEDFDQRMQRLSEQSLQEPLVIDLTALNTSAAADASRQVTGVEVKRIACGMQICMVALSAPSIEVFNKWTNSFLSNQPLRARATSGDSATLSDGSTEYRLLFSTDDSVRRVDLQPRK